MAGWDDTRWLDTSTHAGALEHRRLRPRRDLGQRLGLDHPYSDHRDRAEEALNRALASWGNPELRPEHRAELLAFAQRAEGLITASWEKGPYRALRQNALLQLIGISPDLLLQ